MQYTSAIIPYVITACLLAFFGNVLLVNTTAQEEDNESTNAWLDFTSLVTDVSVFVIIGFIGYIATKFNGWMKNNKEWKASIEKNFSELNSKIKSNEDDTKNNVQKLNTAVELLINNLDSFKEINQREMTEIASDYDSLSVIVTENRVEIKNIKEDLKDFKGEVRRNK